MPSPTMHSPAIAIANNARLGVPDAEPSPGNSASGPLELPDEDGGRSAGA